MYLICSLASSLYDFLREAGSNKLTALHILFYNILSRITFSLLQPHKRVKKFHSFFGSICHSLIIQYYIFYVRVWPIKPDKKNFTFRKLMRILGINWIIFNKLIRIMINKLKIIINKISCEYRSCYSNFF